MFRMARSPTRAYYERRRLHRLYARQQLRMHNNAKFYKCSGHSTPASHSRVAFNPWVVLSSHLSAARQNRIRVLPIQCPLASELIVFVIQYFIGRFELGFCFAPICVTLIALLYFCFVICGESFITIKLSCDLVNCFNYVSCFIYNMNVSLLRLHDDLCCVPRRPVKSTLKPPKWLLISIKRLSSVLMTKMTATSSMG